MEQGRCCTKILVSAHCRFCKCDAAIIESSTAKPCTYLDCSRCQRCLRLSACYRVCCNFSSNSWQHGALGKLVRSAQCPAACQDDPNQLTSLSMFKRWHCYPNGPLRPAKVFAGARFEPQMVKHVKSARSTGHAHQPKLIRYDSAVFGTGSRAFFHSGTLPGIPLLFPMLVKCGYPLQLVQVGQLILEWLPASSTLWFRSVPSSTFGCCSCAAPLLGQLFR